jgi:hypothetical protein
MCEDVHKLLPPIVLEGARPDFAHGRMSDKTHLTRAGIRLALTVTVPTAKQNRVFICSCRHYWLAKANCSTGPIRKRQQPGFRRSGRVMLQMLKLGEEQIVIFVGADPEPDDRLFFLNPNCPIVPRDANRIDRVALMHLFEPETRMPRILLKQLVGLPSATLDPLRKVCVCVPKSRSGSGLHS